MKYDLTEFEKLIDLLIEAGIPYTKDNMFDGVQVRIYADDEKINEIDDAVIHSGSRGCQNGLLETFLLNDCRGFETAEQVFEGWLGMYEKAISK
jgi:hypothetical protein